MSEENRTSDGLEQSLDSGINTGLAAQEEPPACVEMDTATTIRQWQTTLISNPADYSETYLKTVHNQVSAIFNFACKYYRLPENPARICGSIGKKNADCMLFWTVDEFKRFIEAVSDKIVSTTIFNLLFWSGMRSGEMLALTLNDFDFDESTVSISKNYARLDNEDLILEPKTPKSKRKVALPPFLCDLVKSYAEKLVDYKPSELLFTVTKHYLKHEMDRGCKKSGVKVIRIHDLRHPYVKHKTQIFRITLKILIFLS